MWRLKFNKLVYTWPMSVKSIYSFHRIVLTAIGWRVWKWTSLFWRTLRWNWRMPVQLITLTKNDWCSEVSSRLEKSFDPGGRPLHQTWQKAKNLSWYYIQKALLLAQWPWYRALICWCYHAFRQVTMYFLLWEQSCKALACLTAKIVGFGLATQKMKLVTSRH